MSLLTVILTWALCTGGHSALLQENSSTAHVEALIQRLATGNIKDEEAAKLELMQHPTPESLPVLLKALPSSEVTIRDDIIDILASYKDIAKIPALIAYKANGWGERSVDSQLAELGAPAVDALIQSLPDDCSPSWGRNSAYASWVGSVLRDIEPEGTRAMLAGLVTQQPCVHEAARSGLIVPRPGGLMGPEDGDMDAGLFSLVDAAENDNPAIHGTAVNWIHSLQSQGWAKLEYSQFLEAIIATYRSNVNGQTRTEIARMLARFPCRRADRFMRAAVHSPIAEIRRIATRYLRQQR